MKVIIQRAENASVRVNEEEIGSIKKGLVVLVGVTHDDKKEDASYLANKIVNLRIFEDEKGKMNLSLLDMGGQVLSISQFTLYGETKKGRRPNFMQAAKPEVANDLYEYFNFMLNEAGVEVATGEFGSMMDVSFTNVGPVTLIIDSKDK
ncbi:D-aminoacyl-tRNA deacylase [Saliterribacillus persicus]|uniref:D-aminoacyl-tRNA deacylase n=1 Tax=Saliterribacillus persicus TaxID=930114 RepID=A0A368XEQ6_9BACI|nr:D-aminoacyl-tRNA deacylase [Saliterribacillus persicus]RCW66443.1 D-tyrosyl-tRNA(Tyr) deacylase [Saliterribacillus persicus]